MQIENYDDARASGSAKCTAKGMDVQLPSGVKFFVPAAEILSLRDLCNGHIERFGAQDVYGRPVEVY
jgi:hypothetical protein